MEASNKAIKSIHGRSEKRNLDPSTASRCYSRVTKCISLGILLGLAGCIILYFPKDSLLQLHQHDATAISYPRLCVLDRAN